MVLLTAVVWGGTHGSGPQDLLMIACRDSTRAFWHSSHTGWCLSPAPSPGEGPAPAQSAGWQRSISMVMVGSVTAKDGHCSTGIISQDSRTETRVAAVAAAVPTSARTHRNGPRICQ